MNSTRPRVLLLPGLEGSGELFTGLVEELGSGFEAAIVRYPNSCRTYADAAAIVREAMPGSRPVILVAESFSTPLAVQVAGETQDAMDGLVLCNGFVSNPLSKLESMWAAAAAPWFFRLPLTSMAVRTFLVGPDAPGGLVDAVLSAIAPVSADVLCARFQATLRCDAREALQRLTVPMLYLHGTRDRLIGEAGLKEILRVRPDVEVDRVDGPHLLFQREPRRCAEIVRRFVDRVAGRPARN